MLYTSGNHTILYGHELDHWHFGRLPFCDLRALIWTFTRPSLRFTQVPIRKTGPHSDTSASPQLWA